MQQPAEDTSRIASSASKVSIAVMCSRVLGLIREQAFAILFGAGFAFDSFVVAFRIPNLLRDLFGEGALSAAFVTVFSDYDETRGREATWKLAGNVIVFIAILLSFITLLGILFADKIVLVLVDADFEKIPDKVALTHLLTMIMFPFLIFISLSSVVMKRAQHVVCYLSPLYNEYLQHSTVVKWLGSQGSNTLCASYMRPMSMA